MMKKKIAITASVIVLGIIGGVSAEMTNQPKTGAATSPLVQEVNNHETRIGNAEKNIRDLQGKTNTPTASDVVTPATTSNAPLTDSTTNTLTGTSSTASTSQPAPVTVVSFKEIVIDPDTSDCEYTYSDGTTYQFHWKTVIYTSSGIKGYQTNGYCDQKAIGQTKVN